MSLKLIDFSENQPFQQFFRILKQLNSNNVQSLHVTHARARFL